MSEPKATDAMIDGEAFVADVDSHSHNQLRLYKFQVAGAQRTSLDALDPLAGTESDEAWTRKG